MCSSASSPSFSLLPLKLSYFSSVQGSDGAIFPGTDNKEWLSIFLQLQSPIGAGVLRTIPGFCAGTWSQQNQLPLCQINFSTT